MEVSACSLISLNLTNIKARQSSTSYKLPLWLFIDCIVFLLQGARGGKSNIIITTCNLYGRKGVRFISHEVCSFKVVCNQSTDDLYGYTHLAKL